MLTYSQVTFQDLREQFGVEVQGRPFLPVPVVGLALPMWLQAFLDANPLTPAITKSEKALSEAVIYPILAAVRGNHEGKLGLFSGEPLNAAGLVSICDFVFTTSAYLFEARPPILVLVEAKQQDLLKAVPQCVAEMVAAQEVNRLAGASFPAVYGCVTTGSQWQFLKLENQQALVDPQNFFFPDVRHILGALNWIIEQFTLAD